MKISAFIEKANDGTYSIINDEGLKGCYLVGFGNTVEEAKEDFYIAAQEIYECWIEDGKKPLFHPSEIEVNFHDDNESPDETS